MSRRRKRTYSKELKLTAVQAYLNGEGSYETLRKKYGIVNVTQLKRWVKWYNGHKECKERRGAGTEIYMAKGIKTTQEERGKIRALFKIPLAPRAETWYNRSRITNGKER